MAKRKSFIVTIPAGTAKEQKMKIAIADLIISSPFIRRKKKKSLLRKFIG